MSARRSGRASIMAAMPGTDSFARHRLAPRGGARRTLDERLAVRFPGLSRLLARAVLRASPGSRVRGAFVRRTAERGAAAVNRGDYEAAFVLYHPALEATFPQQLATLGAETDFATLAARIEFQRQWVAEWREFGFEARELIDLGDRLLVLGRVRASGRVSGARLDDDWGLLVTLSDGQVIREQTFIDHDEALAAAGIPRP